SDCLQHQLVVDFFGEPVTHRRKRGQESNEVGQNLSPWIIVRQLGNFSQSGCKFIDQATIPGSHCPAIIRLQVGNATISQYRPLALRAPGITEKRGNIVLQRRIEILIESLSKRRHISSKPELVQQASKNI